MFAPYIVIIAALVIIFVIFIAPLFASPDKGEREDYRNNRGKSRY